MDAPELAPLEAKSWTVALRSWPESDGGKGAFLSNLAKKHNARLRLLPLQPQQDEPLLRKYLQEHGDSARDEYVGTTAMPVRQIVGEACRGELMIAMRLHSLIFAAARGVPCIAINYDPKVQALAEIGAGEFSCFNSTRVRLKAVTMLLTALMLMQARISIPYWCD